MNNIVFWQGRKAYEGVKQRNPKYGGKPLNRKTKTQVEIIEKPVGNEKTAK